MNPTLRGEGAHLAKRFQPVRQKEELVGATLLRLSRVLRCSAVTFSS